MQVPEGLVDSLPPEGRAESGVFVWVCSIHAGARGAGGFPAS